MESAIKKFVNLIIKSDSPYQYLDRIYVTNLIFRLIGDGDDYITKNSSTLTLSRDLINLAIKHHKINDTYTDCSILQAQLMDLLTPLPSKLNNIFWNKYQEAPKMAVDYFYKICCNNNYIKINQIKKNIYFIYHAYCGNLEITINLSKPEINAKLASKLKTDNSNYPLNRLAIENEGYLGRTGYPARSNHRVIRMMVNGKPWGFQFSPYSYFKEHTIFFSQKHEPMNICEQTFVNLFDIVKQFPYYFVGSNSNLPSVGGSVLSQNHYQGGPRVFPLMRAKIDRIINFNIKGLSVGIVKWPVSTIRLYSKNSNLIIRGANKILDCWKNYSDKSVNVISNINNKFHHTITPIAYKVHDYYVLDIVLRDDHSTVKYPYGIFNTHKQYRHIKADSIGLMEVMGRAILPPRLKPEMNEVRKYLLGQENNMKSYHKKWADQLKRTNNITPNNVKVIIYNGIGNVFLKILENSGVFKWNKKGQYAFNKFVNTAKNMNY